MNQKTAYEQIITGKLQAAPVPDMADAIWARIEAQLDIDMPDTDAPPPPDPPRTPSGGTILGGISLVFVIAFITFILLKKEANKQPTITTPANAPAKIQKGFETFLPPDRATGLPSEKTTFPAVAPVLPPALPDSSTVSVINSPMITANDSTTAIPAVATFTPVITPQKQDTLLPVKKGRGVAGIKDEDYKIVPKKDSSNN